MTNFEENKKVIRVALYIRVSSEEQVRHGYSLDSQRKRLIEYCREKKYKIIGIYADEGKSARTKLKNRKQLLELIEDAKNNEFDRIIFWRLDRWFRNVSDYYKIQDILESNKIDWECTDEEYNTTTSNGRLHLNIKLSIAQNESDQTSDRIKFNFNMMVKNGNVIVGKQGMPLGYTIGGEKRAKKMIKDKETEEITIDMWDNIKLTGSIRKTLMYINNKYNLKICYDSMRHYFMNTKYYGCYKGIENYCPPYITKEEFDEVQKLVKRNVKCNKRHEYIFSGMLVCEICHKRLAGCTTVCINKNNEKHKYPSYRCNRRYQGLCTYSKKPVEKTVENYLLNNIETELNKYILELKEISEKKEKLPTYNIDTLRRKIDRLNDLYIDDKITKDKYDFEYDKIQELIANINENKDNKKDYTYLKEIINSNALDIYNRLSNENKRMFWKEFIDYIIITEDNKYEIHFY